MRTHYGPWQPCWISNQHQKHKSGRGPSSEHFWQVWLISVQRFQRRRFKCEKLTDGRRTLTHDKSSHGLWPGELKSGLKRGMVSLEGDIWIKYYYLSASETRCCTLRRAKNTPTRSFVSRTVNRKQMCGKPGKGRHGTSHHAKAIYQI